MFIEINIRAFDFRGCLPPPPHENILTTKIFQITVLRIIGYFSDNQCIHALAISGYLQTSITTIGNRQMPKLLNAFPIENPPSAEYHTYVKLNSKSKTARTACTVWLNSKFISTILLDMVNMSF